MTIYKVRYDDHEIRYRFLCGNTDKYFRRYSTLSEEDKYDISLTRDELESYRHYFPPDVPDEYIEIKLLISKTSKKLLAYTACIFHSVSFVFKGKAWLLSAPSGTGKTTQYLNWRKRFPDEIQMICGDMPVLEKTGNNTVRVYPSPWNGKEKIGTHLSAGLGGIIFLKQGEKNSIRQLSIRESIERMMEQYVIITDTEEEIIHLAELTDCILRNHKVFEFTNTGNTESTEYLREAIIHEIQNA